MYVYLYVYIYIIYTISYVYDITLAPSFERVRIYVYTDDIYIADTRRTNVISGFLPITRERSRRCTDYGERASEGRKKAAAKEWRREDRGPWDG